MFEIGLQGVLGGLGAAMAALVLWAFQRYLGKAPRHRGVLTGAMTGLFMLVGNQTLAPPVRMWRANDEIARAIRSDSLLSVVVAASPSAEKSIREGMLRSLATHNDRYGVDAVASAVGQVLPEYLKSVPNDAIVNYTAKMTQYLRGLALKSPDQCYGLLFPKAVRSSTTAPVSFPVK